MSTNVVNTSVAILDEANEAVVATAVVTVAPAVVARYNERQIENEPRAVAAANTNTTDIVEYSGSTSTISTPSTTTTSERGGRSGGRFGPRRN